MRVREQRQPLKVIRAFPLPDGGVLAHLMNLSGGVLGGDRLETQIDVGPDAAVQLTTTGATRLYRSRTGTGEATHRTLVTVSTGGLLEYLPDPLIPYAGSRFRQETRIDLSPGAGLIWWEVVAPGREAHGEYFAYERLETRFSLFAEGRPLLIEQTCLEPGVRPLTSPARLGPYRTFATLTICRVGRSATDWLVQEQRLREWAETHSRPGEILWGVSTLRAHGLTIRALARSGQEVAAGLWTLWRLIRKDVFGREAILPRKVY